MADAARDTDLAARLLDALSEGAQVVTLACLQPAALLLDVYGEAIRARAYTTFDPVDGEMMLRPDFTVPVTHAHLKNGHGAARYAYAGPVWRRPEPGSDRPREYLQVGFESFGAAGPAADEAEVFARIATAVEGSGAAPVIGDLGLIFAAIDGLNTSLARKDALSRHVWRPRRFERLLQRFAGKTPFECDTRALPAPPQAPDGPGRRGAQDVADRLRMLAAERETPPLRAEEVALFDRLTALNGPASSCLADLEALGATAPHLAAPVAAFADRLAALEAKGFAPDTLTFDGGLGRRTMEYYDGFVFAFIKGDAAPPIAQGGRYDALTRVLGDGTAVPAVGGIVRPGPLADALEGRA